MGAARHTAEPEKLVVGVRCYCRRRRGSAMRGQPSHAVCRRRGGATRVAAGRRPAPIAICYWATGWVLGLT